MFCNSFLPKLTHLVDHQENRNMLVKGLMGKKIPRSIPVHGLLAIEIELLFLKLTIVFGYI